MKNIKQFIFGILLMVVCGPLTISLAELADKAASGSFVGLMYFMFAFICLFVTILSVVLVGKTVMES